jgi:hypothetical protein
VVSSTIITLPSFSRSPDVLALVQWIEDPIPSRLEVKDRHIKDEHWIVPASTWSQGIPQVLALAKFWLGKIA